MTTEAGPKTLYLVDGTAQLFRAYFALPPLTNADGLPTHAIYGFTTMLRKLMNDEKPTHLAVAFDLPGETFRHDRYAEYKANRPPTPEDLNVQAPYAKEVCRAFRIPVLELGGYEADDLIATYARLAREQDFDVVVVASDKDLLQLVGDRVRVLNPVKEIVIDAEGTREAFGVAPELVADVLGLMGDSVDNIPGVPGVGRKTALAMVRQYGGLDSVIARAARFVALYDARDAVLESVAVADGEDPLSDAAAAGLMRSIREAGSRLDELREHEADPEFQSRLETLSAVLGAVPIDDLEGHAGKKGRTVTRDLRVLKRELKGLDRGSAKRGWYAVHENVEQARLSRELATLDREVPVSFDPRAVTLGPPDREQARELFRTLGFQALLAGLDDEQEPGEFPDPAPPRRSEYSTVGTPEQLEQLVVAARKRGRFALHTRTDGPDALQANLLGIPMAVEGETAAYVPWDGDADSAAGRSAQLRGLLVDPEVTKVAHDLKRHLKVLSRRGLAIEGWELDTRVAAFLLDPGRARLDLGALAAEFLGRSFEQVEPDSRRAGDLPLETADSDPATARAVEAVEIVLGLADVLRSRLDDAGLGELYRTIDGPLLPVLASMELTGIRVEAGMLASMSVEMEASMDRLRGEIHQLSGVEFNVDSPKQLREVLFERLGLEPKRKTAKSKVSSTDARTLEDLRSEHPIARKILEYRELAKLKGTYVDALPQLINPSTGRIHTTYDPTGAATGRLSSSDPNLQNIPARSEAGLRIRSAFVPEPGYLFLSSDYSQVELRVLADLSGDPELSEAFHRGEDIHRHTASLVYGIDPNLVSDGMRRRAKAVNFGIVYGMSEIRLAAEQAMTRGEARKFIGAYFERFASVKDYIERVRDEVRHNGSVRTLFGRVRYFPQLQQKVNRAVQEQAMRAAVNTTVQGTAADLMKMAMLRAQRALSDAGAGARMLLQVHDELLFEVPEAEIEQTAALVREALEKVHRLAVPLVVDQKVGKSWKEVT